MKKDWEIIVDHLDAEADRISTTAKFQVVFGDSLTAKALFIAADAVNDLSNKIKDVMGASGNA
jgi:hypothetical protein